MKQLKDYEYYKTELGTLYCGDCLEIFPLIKDKIELVLTDPPYGINCDNQIQIRKPDRKSTWDYGNGKYEKAIWDNQIPDKKIFELMLKISDNQIIFGGNYFTDYLYSSRCWIFWDKLFDKTTNFSHGELARTSFNSQLRKYTISSKAETKGGLNKSHPTQKPVTLFKSILKDYSKGADLILDPFLGSGTTAVACEKLNRRWIGIEISEKYCEIAKQRIENEYNKLKLFK